MTREQGVLEDAIDQLNKVPLKEQRGPQERLHLKSLLCRVESEENTRELTFLQSFLLPIQKWADKQLGDYHLHFPEVHKQMKITFTFCSVILGRCLIVFMSGLANKYGSLDLCYSVVSFCFDISKSYQF